MSGSRVVDASLAVAVAVCVAATLHSARIEPGRRVGPRRRSGPAGPARGGRRPTRAGRRAAAGGARVGGAVHDLAQVVDLLAVAVAAGCNVRLAAEAVVRSLDGPAVDALAVALRRVDAGATRLADALSDLHLARPSPSSQPPRARAWPPSGPQAVAALAAAVGRRRRRAGRERHDRDGLRSLGRLLADAERFGTPLAPALERLAADLRDQRRRRAEVAARRLPVRLLLPLVCCVLPAFALLTVAPLLVSGLRALTFDTPGNPVPPPPISTEVPPP